MVLASTPHSPFSDQLPYSHLHYLVDIYCKMKPNHKDRNVSNLESYCNIWDKRAETNDGVHHEHQNDLIKQLLVVSTLKVEWLHISDDNDRSNDLKSHQHDLPNQDLVKNNHCNCQ